MEWKIDRRQLWGLLAGVPLLGLAATRDLLPEESTDQSVSSGKQDRYRLLRTWVADYPAPSASRLRPPLPAGQRLELRREPVEPGGEPAVTIHWQNHRLGYLPRQETPVIVRLLEQGAPVQCRLIQLDARAPAWYRLEVELILALPV